MNESSVELELNFLYDSKSPDRGDHGSDDSGDGTTIMVVMKVMTLVVTVVVTVVMCNAILGTMILCILKFSDGNSILLTPSSH